MDGPAGRRLRRRPADAALVVRRKLRRLAVDPVEEDRARAALQDVTHTLTDVSARVERLSAGLSADIGAREALDERTAGQLAAVTEALRADIAAREAVEAALAQERAAREAVEVELAQERRAREAVAAEVAEERAALRALTASVAVAAADTARKSAVSRLERAVARLEERATASAPPPSPEAQSPGAPSPGALAGPRRADAATAPGGSRLYLAIEDELRGDPEDIRGLQVDYARRIAALVGPGGRVADLGCGRGEFLLAAAAEDLVPIGVDTNEDAVAEVRALGHEAVHEDALGFLRGCADGSLDAVTLFHVIEHVGFEAFVEIVREIERVLRPGGALAMETPNVANIEVGSHTFWLDPTHVRPIPPLLLELVVRNCGFDQVDMLHLHANPQLALVTDDVRTEQPLLARVAESLLGPQDIGIVARRGSG